MGLVCSQLDNAGWLQSSCFAAFSYDIANYAVNTAGMRLATGASWPQT
jgi:hypothetical protein